MDGSGALARPRLGSGPVAGREVGMGGATVPLRVKGDGPGLPDEGRTDAGGRGPERGEGRGPVVARLGMTGSVPDPRRGGTEAVLCGARWIAGEPPAMLPAGGGFGAVFFLTRRENFS